MNTGFFPTRLGNTKHYFGAAVSLKTAALFYRHISSISAGTAAGRRRPTMTKLLPWPFAQRNISGPRTDLSAVRLDRLELLGVSQVLSSASPK